jgi:glucose-6-phosphate isomerase
MHRTVLGRTSIVPAITLAAMYACQVGVRDMTTKKLVAEETCDSVNIVQLAPEAVAMTFHDGLNSV